MRDDFFIIGSFSSPCHRRGSGVYTYSKLLYAVSWVASRCYARWSSYYTSYYIELMRYSGTGSAKFEVGNNMLVQPFASV